MYAKSFASALLTATLVATGILAISPRATGDTVEIIDHNASIVVNGWKLKADTITRRPDGVVKLVGNARASHDGYACSGSAWRIVLNTGADRISFFGEPKVVLDGQTHVAHGGTGLVFNYRKHSIDAVAE